MIIADEKTARSFTRIINKDKCTFWNLFHPKRNQILTFNDLKAEEFIMFNENRFYEYPDIKLKEKDWKYNLSVLKKIEIFLDNGWIFCAAMSRPFVICDGKILGYEYDNSNNRVIPREEDIKKDVMIRLSPKRIQSLTDIVYSSKNESWNLFNPYTKEQLRKKDLIEKEFSIYKKEVEYYENEYVVEFSLDDYKSNYEKMKILKPFFDEGWILCGGPENCLVFFDGFNMGMEYDLKELCVVPFETDGVDF